MTPPDELHVVLRPIGDGPPAEVRFRRALKALTRLYGLRAYWPTSGPVQTPATPPAMTSPPHPDPLPEASE